MIVLSHGLLFLRLLARLVFEYLSSLLLLLPVPIILDIVFLPVAVPRDLIVRGHLDD